MIVTNLLRATSLTVMKPLAAAGLLLMLGIQPGIAAADLSTTTQFNIAPQPLPSALLKYSEQSGVQVTSPAELLEGKSSSGVVGMFAARTALERLLAGSELGYNVIDQNTVAIRLASSGQSANVHSGSSGAGKPDASEAAPQTNSLNRSAQASPSDRASDAEAEKNKDSREEVRKAMGPEIPRAAIPEVLVQGSRILNTDVKRHRDDTQPYVVFERDVIEQSGATNVQDFIRQRLPMDTHGARSNQGGSDNRSLINLRGLGTNQTLILIDGRRAVNVATTANTPQQSDLNGIPLAAIERIEVLPTTASGIYGGSATGGVVNIILRRDYSGVEAKITYDNSFRSDSSTRRIDLSGGFSLEGGRTRVMLAGSYADANQLATHDRDFIQRGLQTVLANNPDALLIFGFFPPLGATTNIRSADGSPLFGPGTPSFTSVPADYAGGGGLAPLQANAGQYNLNLANSAQLFGGGTRGLLAGSTLASLMTTIRREFGPNVEAFLDLSASKNTGESVDSGVFFSSYFIPAAAANNPFGKDILVTVPVAAGDGLAKSENHDRRVAGGVIVRLPREWSAAGDYTWSRSRLEATNRTRGLSGAEAAEISNGSLDVLRDTNAFPIDFGPFLTPPSQNSPFVATSRDAVLRLAGPVSSLPAGPLTLSGLVELRDDDIDAAQTALPAFNLTLFFPSRSQSVDSAYLELKAPLASEKSNVTGIRELELQIAARYDEYTVNGATGVTFSPTDPVERVTNKRSSTNPTFGLRYKPVSDVMFRGSYGTGFLPPAVNQLLQGPPFPATVVDPQRGGESQTVPVTSGGNPDLKPEDSESWSAGVVLTPRFMPGLRLSVDWSRIKKTDNIVTPFGSPQLVVNNEALVPELVTRDPAPPGDPFGVGPITAVNMALLNIARAEVEAYDVGLDYLLETASVGSFSFSAVATWQTHLKTQLNPTAPIEEKVGLSNSNPLKIKGNARLNWEYGPWLLGWTTRYFDGYALDNSFASFGPSFDFVKSQGAASVPSQTYHDFLARYRFPSSGGGGSRILSDTEVQLGIRNVFDKKPPLDVSNTVSYYSFFGDPRLASYYLSLKKSF